MRYSFFLRRFFIRRFFRKNLITVLYFKCTNESYFFSISPFIIRRWINARVKMELIGDAFIEKGKEETKTKRTNDSFNNKRKTLKT